MSARRWPGVVVLVLLLVFAGCVRRVHTTVTASHLTTVAETLSPQARDLSRLLVELIAARPRDQFAVGAAMARLDCALDAVWQDEPDQRSRVELARALMLQLRHELVSRVELWHELPH